MKVTDLILTEAVHIVHPEDLVFTQGIAGAQRAIAALSQMSTGKELTTIKWDGFPALIFGRNVDGQLMVMDKYMFSKKDGSGHVTSPEAFKQYDAARGADRADLYSKIDLIWHALETIIPANFKGFFMGDLLYAGRLQPQRGFFVFKPNTVTYKVRANSQTGQHIAGSVAGIAVHTFVPGIGEADQPLNGLGGLPTSGPIWFVSGQMPVPRVQINPAAVKQTEALVQKYSGAVAEFLNKLTEIKAKGIVSAMSTYITSRITSGNFDHMLDGFYKYLPTRLSGTAATKLLNNGQGWLYQEGRPGLEGIFAIWVAIYNLKLNIKQQIDQQTAAGDVQAFTGNQAGHEGYVVGGGEEKMKLIDRLGFSRANFAKNG